MKFNAAVDNYSGIKQIGNSRRYVNVGQLLIRRSCAQLDFLTEVVGLQLWTENKCKSSYIMPRSSFFSISSLITGVPSLEQKLGIFDSCHFNKIIPKKVPEKRWIIQNLFFSTVNCQTNVQKLPLYYNNNNTHDDIYTAIIYCAKPYANGHFRSSE